jgi:hypothetical protein
MASPTIPAETTPAKAPPDPAAQRRALALEGRWAALRDLILQGQGQGTGQRGWFYLLASGVATQSRPALARVLEAGFRDTLPGEVRADLAVRLAGEAEQAAALAELLASPATASPEAPLRGAALLRRVLARSQDPGLRACARLLLERLPEQSPPPRSTPFRRLAVSSSRPRPAASLLLHRAAGVPEEAEAELRDLQAQFESRLRQVRPPRVHRLEDVFINRMGQIWRSEGEVLASANRPLPPASLLAMGRAKSIPAGTTAVGATGSGSWFMDWLPSLLWMLDAQGAGLGWKIPFLVADDAPAEQLESLNLLRDRPPPVRAAGDALRVGTLYLADRGLERLVHWDEYAAGFSRLGRQAAKARPPLGTRLYLSGRGQRRQHLAQEAELEAALATLGFHSVSLAEHSPAERIGLLQGASVVVAPHGPGLAHLLGERSGLSVYELLPVLSGGMSRRFDTARISRLRGHRHLLHLVQPDHFTNLWTVDVAEVAEAVARFAEGHPGG